MASNENTVSLGPYTRKQKLYLKTEDGVAMEGEFIKFNPSQTTVLLHSVELIPSDGRIFGQYNAVLSELVCLRPLVRPQVDVNSVASDLAEALTVVPESSNDLVLPEFDNSEPAKQQKAEKFAARKSTLLQKLIEAGLRKENTSDSEPVKTSKTSVPAEPVKTVETSVPTHKETLEDKPRVVLDNKSNSVVIKGSINLKKDHISQVEDRQPTVTQAIYEALKSKAKGYIIIDKPGPLLKSAMEDIERQSTLGLSSHGAESGRLNRLSILSVATEGTIYLLDIHALGKQALTHVLVKALESSSVEKVVYDCRYLSDCLYYSHHIRLQNVYDIQAADCVLYRCRKGSFPNRGRGLQEIVSQYLDLPASLLADNTNITNCKVWFQRPLQEDCYDFAAWQVVFLPQLRVAIDKIFQTLMQNSFDVYLNHVRKMQRADAVETLSTRRQIPVALLEASFTRES